MCSSALKRPSLVAKVFTKSCVVAALLFTAQSHLAAQTGWQFISGSADVSQPNILDEPAHPGARSNAAYATDGNGDLWVFGGEGYASTLNVLNDLWKYDTSERKWTLMAGTGDFMEQPSNYDPAAGPLHPGSRWNAMAWADDAGDFWLFGGYGFGKNWNDFWKYDSSANEWLLISNAANYANESAQINPPPGLSYPGSRQRSTAWRDTSGDFWMYGGTGYPRQGPALFLNDLWRYDTSAEIWVHEAGTTTIGNRPGNQDPTMGDLDPGSRMRASGWSDSSGDLWLFGGTGYVGVETGTYGDLWKFDTSTKKWLIVSGTSAPNQYANLDPGLGPLRPGARFGASSWTDEADNLWLFGGDGFGGPDTWQMALNDLWKFDTVNEEWSLISGTGDFGEEPGVYSGTSQHPGSRAVAAAGYDGDGGMWLFGGLGMPETGGGFHLNDLWKYEIHPPTPNPTTTVSGAAYVNPNTLSITFSAAMDNVTVLTATNYSVHGPGSGGRTYPDTVTAGTNPNEYLLTWTSGSFLHGEPLSLSASAGILDANGVQISPASRVVMIPPGTSGPEPGQTRIASAAFLNRNAISVTFNGEMAPTGGVMEPTNYRISGPGAGTRVGAPVAPPTSPAPLAGGLAPRWADHTPTPANPATVEYLGGNTYRLTWTSGQFVAGQPLIIHVDDEHILDLAGDLLGAPNFITLMIPFDAPGCICPAP